MKKLVLTFTVFAVLSIGLNARGDTDSFSSLTFNPVAGRGPYFVLSDTFVDKPGDVNVALVLDYARTVFKEDAVGGGTRDVNKRMITSHFLFDINLTHFLQVGFNFPIVFYNQFYNPVAPFARDDQFDLGDPMLMVKAEILDPTDKPIGLALIPYVTFPLGNGQALTGTNQFDPGIKLAVEKKWDKASLGLNLGYLFQQDIVRAGIEMDDMITYGLGTSFALSYGLSALAEFDGRTIANDPFGSEIQSPAELLVGLKKNFKNGFGVEVGGAAGLLRGVGSPLGRGFVGVSCNQNCFKKEEKSPQVVEAPRPKDQDGDGVPDSIDDCPTLPGPASNKGCPESDIKVLDDHIETPTIYFETGKAILKMQGQEVLDRLVAAVTARPKIKSLRIEGHTDNQGGRDYNLKLSRNRAVAVKEYLESKSIGIELRSQGFGFDDPIASNKTAAGRAKNRRVEFIILNP